MRILHMLSWPLKDIIRELDNIKKQNFSAIQINPIQPLKEESKDNWWMSYQPISFDIGNIYGSKEDLILLCDEAQKRGITIIADVVINHLAADNYKSVYPHEKVDHKIKNNPYFWKKRQNITKWEDRHQVINFCANLPALNLSNYELQDNYIIPFLNDLIDCGVGGFRFDAAKHIALKREGSDFWPRVIFSLKKWGLFLYGEVIFEKEEILNEYAKYFKLLTNSNYYDKNNTVKFVESHDSYYDLAYTKNLSSDYINERYYEINQEYPHTIYFTRPYDNSWQKEKVRKANLY